MKKLLIISFLCLILISQVSAYNIFKVQICHSANITQIGLCDDYWTEFKSAMGITETSNASLSGYYNKSQINSLLKNANLSTTNLINRTEFENWGMDFREGILNNTLSQYDFDVWRLDEDRGNNNKSSEGLSNNTIILIVILVVIGLIAVFVWSKMQQNNPNQKQPQVSGIPHQPKIQTTNQLREEDEEKTELEKVTKELEEIKKKEVLPLPVEKDLDGKITKEEKDILMKLKKLMGDK